MRQVSEEHVRMHLVRITSAYGQNEIWSQRHGITARYVSQVKCQSRPMSKVVAEALGYWVRWAHGRDGLPLRTPEYYIED